MVDKLHDELQLQNQRVEMHALEAEFVSNPHLSAPGRSLLRRASMVRVGPPPRQRQIGVELLLFEFEPPPRPRAHTPTPTFIPRSFHSALLLTAAYVTIFTAICCCARVYKAAASV